MRYVLVAVCVMWAGVAMAADTLVVKGADGKVGPGAAASWEASGDKVVFTLAAGEDGVAWAQALSERLAGVTAEVVAGRLEVSGMDAPALLDRLAALNLAGGGDPLAELAGLGGGVTEDGPEGGGSIRASKPTAVAMGPRAVSKHDKNERFEAEVVAVDQGAFPQVTLKLKMRKGGRSSALKKKLYYGKIIDAKVVYNVSGGVVDLGDALNRQNLVAWYLKKGDRVRVHPVAAGANYEVDWLSRTR